MRVAGPTCLLLGVLSIALLPFRATAKVFAQHDRQGIAPRVSDRVPFTPTSRRPAGSSGSTFQRGSLHTPQQRQQQQQQEQLTVNENEDVAPYAEPFMLRDSRLGFIRKVYLSLTAQLLFTAGTVIAAGQHKRTLLPWLLAGGNQRLNTLFYGSLAFSVGSLFALQSNDLRRKFPANVALLTLFTASESVMVAAITLFFKSKSVWIALLQTAAATLGLSLYAFQTNPKYDLTGVGSALGSGLTVLLVFGLLRLVFPGTFAFSDMLYSSFAAILFSLFIVYDTQRIIGGKHRTADQVDRKDWVLGSVALYTDIIQLFVQLLQIFGQRE